MKMTLHEVYRWGRTHCTEGDHEIHDAEPNKGVRERRRCVDCWEELDVAHRVLEAMEG